MTDVTLYQTEWCPYSHRVRHLLTVHGVDFQAVNVPASQDARDDLVRATGQRSIPVLVVNGIAYTSDSDIAAFIAERFPRSPDGDAALHELRAAPVAIARLDSGDVDELVRRLRDELSARGWSLLRSEPHDVGVGEQAYVLRNDDVYRNLSEIEPRVRVHLPLKVSVSSHDNGAVAMLSLPRQPWMHFQNRELFRESRKLNQVFYEIVQSVGDRAGIA